jgi:hypothetical protein
MQGVDDGRPLGERVRCGGKRRKFRKWQDEVVGSEQRRSLGVFPPTFCRTPSKSRRKSKPDRHTVQTQEADAKVMLC